MRKSLLVFFIFATALSFPITLTEGAKALHVQAELLAHPLNSSDQTFQVGVLFKLDPEWHIYWRNSGDSGIPTQINLGFSTPCKEGDWMWPTPKRFDEAGITTYGYSDSVLIFKTVTCNSPPSEIKADVRWLSCNKVCIPGKATLKASFPSGDPSLFDQAQKTVPVPNPWDLKVQENGGILTLNLAVSEGFKISDSIEFFPYADDWMDHHAKQSWKVESGLLQLTLKRSELKKGALNVSGTLVANPDWGEPDHSKALEIRAQ